MTFRVGKNVSLQGKMVLSFAVLLAFFLGIALYNVYQVNEIKRQTVEQNAKIELKQEALRFKVLSQEMKDFSAGYMLSRNETYVAQFQEKRPAFENIRDRIGITAETPEQLKRRSGLLASSTEFLDTFDRAVRILQDKSLKEQDIQMNITSIYNQSQQQRDILFGVIDGFYADFSTDVQTAMQASDKLMDWTTTVMLVCSLLVLLTGLAVSFWITHSFRRQISRLHTAVVRLSEGDLRHKIQSAADDELGRLSGNFNIMVDRVSEMVLEAGKIAGSLTHHSDSFRSFASETASVNTDITAAIREIAAGAGSQADHTEESASFLAELDGEIESIWESAQMIQETSIRTEKGLHVGQEAVKALSAAAGLSEEKIENTMKAMAILADSSSRIGEITKALTDIASQTNILALNASIEASRAGEQGRGFAVIAEEVRKLSLEARNSSESIGGIVDGLVLHTRTLQKDLMEARTGLYAQNSNLKETLSVFDDIGGSVREMAQQFNRVHNRVEEARTNSGRLTASVQSVSAVAQQTAASSEEVTAASVRQNEAIAQIAGQAEEIHALSAELFAQIAKFQVSEG